MEPTRPSIAVRLQDDILRHEHIEPKPWTDFEGGLDVQVLAGQLLSRLIGVLRGALCCKLRKAWISAGVAALRDLFGRAQERSQHHTA